MQRNFFFFFYFCFYFFSGFLSFLFIRFSPPPYPWFTFYAPSCTSTITIWGCTWLNVHLLVQLRCRLFRRRRAGNPLSAHKSVEVWKFQKLKSMYSHRDYGVLKPPAIIFGKIIVYPLHTTYYRFSISIDWWITPLFVLGTFLLTIRMFFLFFSLSHRFIASSLMPQDIFHAE